MNFLLRTKEVMIILLLAVQLSTDNFLGTLVRVRREAPLDHDVCEHFLEALVLQKLVE
jgi:hypothetical protein